MWLLLPSALSRSAPEAEASNSACPSSCAHTWWVTSSGTPTPRPCSWRGWATRPWHRLLSGAVTSPTWTPGPLVASTSSAPGSPARPSQAPGDDGAPTTTDGSGRRSPGFFATLAHGSCSSRTCVACWCRAQASLLDSATFSATWPPSGSMRSGAVYERATLAPRTSASGCSSWPTATVIDSEQRGEADGMTGTLVASARLWQTPSVADTTGGHGTRGGSRSGELQLNGQARMWPTPVAYDDNKSPEAHLAMKARMPGGPRSTVTSLNVASKLWPTPTAAEGQRGSDPERERPNGASLNGASLSWPTPRTRDEKGRGYVDSLPTLAQAVSLSELPPQDGRARRRVPPASGRPAPTTPTDGDGSSPPARVLNPRFVEMLMGWPPSWTDCASSVTAASLSRWRSRSTALLAALGCGEDA